LLPSLVAAVVIVGLAFLPDLGPKVAIDNLAIEAYHGRILEIVPRTGNEPLRPPNARVEILDGARAGQVLDAYLEGPGGSQIVANYQAGEEVLVTISKDSEDASHIAVSDRWRAPLLGGFVILFAIAVAVVGGLRGVRALLSLGLTIAIILKVLIPLVISGFAPVPLAVLTAIAVTVVTIVLTEGWTRASGAAILGTAGALALTGLLAAAATALASFTYTAGSDLAFIETVDGRGLDLRGILLAAFILGTIGVLDDVTVTQAAVVDSLAARGVHGRELLGSAFEVGRSHIAATINTLFLAYVGAGLPLLVTILVSNQPSALIFNSEAVGVEVIRTIVGSLGILAAVPLTTFVAAAILDRPGGTEAHSRRDRTAVALAAAVTVAALAATAILPLGQGRAALPESVFEPLPSPGSIGASPSRGIPSASDGAPPSDAIDPVVLAAGDIFVLETGTSTVAITIDAVDVEPAGADTTVTIGVTYENDGPAPFIVELAAWTLLAASGEDLVMRPTETGGLQAARLAAGQTSSGRLTATVSATPDDTFVTYTDSAGTLVLVVPANGS
jgi:uncharacterized membrane protein